MSESKEQFYQSLSEQLTALLEGETNWLTNLSQFSAFLNMQLEDINWVGFYLSQPDSDLLLGPFQGNVACVRIPLGKGVCGTAAQKQKTLVVEDVDQFDGHIACDARSRSEVVCPLVIDGKLWGVLDIDSPSLNRFDQQDADGLENLMKILIDATEWSR
ncbi:GAF domain-containing protein [Aliikangiella coralliicola]|uniref:GAF domain-containing protein n=1 Tax=Aliikangiella coralliicola TaxID=2592383 RepID=A0A545U4L9_9GAMM|nr:GAF domain-containing protein [Aliikangiella coralliicola]TQV84425.1 GAF domain-containing protein [Aliikangiella coralliicola]